VPAEKISSQNIIDFYSTKLFPDQLKGVFAETILLVEGATEFFTLPIYLKKSNFSLAENGIEIINCRGKASIPIFWRLFEAYGYNCYPIFDCDCNPTENNKIFTGLINSEEWVIDESLFFIGDSYAYFGKDFESYLKSEISKYDEFEKEVVSEFQITSKPGIAKAIAQYLDETPSFIEKLKENLELIGNSA
jgi:putative ATP-dependent endonuclease of OLD family